MNYTQEEIKQAKRKAYSYLYGYYNIYFHKPFSYDRRTRVGNLANAIVLNNKLSCDEKERVKNLRKERKNNKPNTYTNILSNPLVRDWVSNKYSVTEIHKDRLRFGRRNHWAKNEKDRRILSVILNNSK